MEMTEQSEEAVPFWHPPFTECRAKGGAGEISVPEGLAAEERPALDRTPVAGLQVSVLGLQDEGRINLEVKHGFILEVNGN